MAEELRDRLAQEIMNARNTYPPSYDSGEWNECYRLADALVPNVLGFVRDQLEGVPPPAVLARLIISIERAAPDLRIEAYVQGIGVALGAQILRHVADGWDPPKAADHG